MEQAYKEILTKAIGAGATPLLLKIIFQAAGDSNWDGTHRLGSNDPNLVLAQVSKTIVDLDAIDLFTRLSIDYVIATNGNSTFDIANMPTYSEDHILDLAEEEDHPDMAEAIRKAGGVAKRLYHPITAPDRNNKGYFDVWFDTSRREADITCYWNIIGIVDHVGSGQPKVDAHFLALAILAYAINQDNTVLIQEILEELSPDEFDDVAQANLAAIEVHAMTNEKYEILAILNAFKKSDLGVMPPLPILSHAEPPLSYDA